MNGWVYANAVVSLICGLVAAYKLGAYPEKFNVFEKAGLGGFGGNAVLTIGPILSRATGRTSPYDDWSVILFKLSILVYLIGRLYRHEWNNYQMRQAARRHLASRGKL